MDSYIVFDPSIVVLKESAAALSSVGRSAARLEAKPGDPEILYSHIIAITPAGDVELMVGRLSRDGNVVVEPGFAEVRDKNKALAEAAAGKLVLWLHTPW
jgi:hypothetical protein